MLHGNNHLYSTERFFQSAEQKERPMKMILKHKKFNLFWHRRDGFVHYDDAERFEPDDAAGVWIPKDYVGIDDDSGIMLECAEWLPDDGFVQLGVRTEDFVEALKIAAENFCESARSFIDRVVLVGDLYDDEEENQS
jgi:hypothetical protein